VESARKTSRRPLVFRSAPPQLSTKLLTIWRPFKQTRALP